MNHKHVLRVNEWTRNEYGGFEALELWESESGKSYVTSFYTQDGKRTRGIRLYGQCNLRPMGGDTKGMYALDVRAMDEISMRDIEDAYETVKRIKSIEKKYTAMCKKYGYPSTFTQFSAFIADIIGAELVEQSPYDQDEFLHLSIEEIQYKEDRLTGNKA